MNSRAVKNVIVNYDDGTSNEYEKGAFVTIAEQNDGTVDVKIVFINMTGVEAVDLFNCLTAGAEVIVG